MLTKQIFRKSTQKILLKVLLDPDRFKKSRLYNDPNWYLDTTCQQVFFEEMILGLARKFPKIVTELDKEDYINTLKEKHRILPEAVN